MDKNNVELRLLCVKGNWITILTGKTYYGYDNGVSFIITKDENWETCSYIKDMFIIDKYNKDWYDENWFNQLWYNKDWFNIMGRDKNWYDKSWYDENWYDRNWFNNRWRHKNWMDKDEMGNTKIYYETIDAYDKLFTWNIRKKEDVYQVKTRDERHTHCWKCTRDINNLYMLECKLCKRIICPSCWSCGCWYKYG